MRKHTGNPNVVLTITDRQRADTMPWNRRADVETPHLEWLARQSTSFRRAYCTAPLCSPSRASMLSGLYPHSHGMVANHQEREFSNELHLPESVRLLADYLKPAGYACGYAGKWHLGTGSDRRGFGDFAGRPGDFDVDRIEDNEVLEFADKVGIKLGGRLTGMDPNPADFDTHTRVGSSLLPLAWHSAMLMATRSVGFVERMAREDRPFLLAYSTREPHPPFVSPRPFDRMYSPKAMPLPETRRDEDGPTLLRYRPDWQLRPSSPYTDEELQAMWAGYYGAVSYVDHLVGLILAALVREGVFDDTLFIYTSDHGEMLGSHGLLGMGIAFYEELVNVPLMIRPPGGLDAPRATSQLVSHLDLVPTILKWCGVEAPAGLHGTDIRALVEGQDAPVHDGVGFEYHSGNWAEEPYPMRGWVTQDWKYVETIGGDDELYDLRHDPRERHNLIADSRAAGTLAEMKRSLHDWLARTSDTWPEIPRPSHIVPKQPGGPWHTYR